MYRRLFGVPDEITDVMRSLEMEDIKIDILDHVIRTPEVFRMVSGKTGVPEGLPEPPGGTNGPPWALLEREEGSKGRPPPLQSELDKGRGARPCPSLLSYLPPRPNKAH